MQEMKNYYIVNSETKIIENVVVATEDVAKDMGLFETYEGAWIGDVYSPPIPEEELNPDKDTLKYMDNALNDGINEI